MAVIEFEIAKKMTRPAPKAPGLALRRLKGTAASASAILLDLSGYDDIKAQLSETRLAFGIGLSYRTRGKSLELNASGGDGQNALFNLLDFLKDRSFNSEDVLDVMEFYRTSLVSGSTPAIEMLAMDLEPDSLSIAVRADIEEGELPETIYSGLAPSCSKCGMGIIKEHPATLSENS